MGLESVNAAPVAPPPPKAATPPASSSSGSSGAGASSSASHQASSGSSNAANNPSGSSAAANRSAPKSPAKSGSSTSNRNATSSTQGQNASASSQTKQNASSTPTAAAGSASGTKNVATPPGTATGPSFIEALAQSQADAADSASAATTVTADASPEDVIGGGKAKATKDDDTDPTAASFGFLSQSLVAAMVGGQQPNTGIQGAATGDSTDGVSLASGSTIESVVANLTNGAADSLQGTTTAGGDDKTAGPATGTSAADGSASGTSGFQAQMAVSSHFQTNSTANTQTTNDKVSSPVGSTAFNDEVGGKVTWMASQKMQSASLQLSPEHMGPVQVRISIQDGATSVAFSANHADTRAALEQALPRLREMFATQGLTLSDASVSQQSPRGQSQKQAVAAIGASGGASTEDDSTSSIAAVSSARPGLVDTYA